MSLLDYCITEHQRKVITLHEEGLGYQKIGERLGIGKYSARDIVKNVKEVESVNIINVVINVLYVKEARCANILNLKENVKYVLLTFAKWRHYVIN